MSVVRGMTGEQLAEYIERRCDQLAQDLCDEAGHPLLAHEDSCPCGQRSEEGAP